MRPRRVDIKHVLCPTDFSEFSERALRHAMAIARHFDARLTVLHVIPDPLSFGAMLPYPACPDGPAAGVVRKQAAEALASFVAPAMLDRVRVTEEVREGVTWRQIREAARTLPADLVVMGTHGRGGFERLVLGSVTEQVLRHVDCPILTVCHEEGRSWAAPGLISRILCATDLSETSEDTVSFALSLAAENQAHVTLLHAIEGLPEEGQNDYVVTFRKHLTETLASRLHESVPEEARAWCEVEERIEVGKAYQRILQRAAEDRADLIVVGEPARSAVKALLFGSTAQHVVREATCPVLSVRRALARVEERQTGALTLVEKSP
jgi:nucleotide-binding universal stress UspA family protein